MEHIGPLTFNGARYFFGFLALIGLAIVLEKNAAQEFRKNSRKIISEIINDPTITKAARNYEISKQESFWIPKAIFLRSQFFLEFACDIRANQTIKMRRKGKS